jgi:radical SAM protein with 4Fe4S-binding SPASM domain
VPELIYGHIETEQLEDIWLHSPGILKLRETIPDRLEGICGQCLMKNLCLGSCVAHTYYDTGTFNAPYWFCSRAVEQGLFPASRKKT